MFLPIISDIIFQYCTLATTMEKKPSVKPTKLPCFLLILAAHNQILNFCGKKSQMPFMDVPNQLVEVSSNNNSALLLPQ